MTDSKEYNRAFAIKIPIVQLLQGTYIQEKEQNPNYLLTTDNQKIYRLNLLGIIIHKEQIGTITNLILDDGTESITIRSFEENKNIFNTVVGDIIQVIGKVRVYNEEKYISPEIVKKINPLWLKIRSLEMEKIYSSKNIVLDVVDSASKIDSNEKRQEIKTKKEKKAVESKEELKKEQKKSTIYEEEINRKIIDIEETTEENNELPSQKMIKLIKELDQGEGALIEDIIEQFPLNETEKIIEKMLEKGDIFQNQPGKVKVL